MQLTYIGNFLSGRGLNPTYSEALVPRLRELGCRISTASNHLNPALRFADIVQRILRSPRKGSWTIIDFYSGPRAFYVADFAASLCRATGRKYILVLHGGTLPARLETSPKRLVRTLQGASRVTSPSQYLAKSLGMFARIEVIPNAIQVANYPFRRRTNVQPNCLYLRAIHRNCGALVAIEAMNLVQSAYPNLKLNMAGPDMDDSREECEQLIARHSLQGRVRLLGRINKQQIAQFGNEADVFLNPTFADNTPVSVVEAMAMGLCIVATDVGGLPFLLKHEHSALLVPVGHPQAIAESILRLVQDPDLSSHLSQTARMEAEAMDWSRVLPRWRRLLGADRQDN